MISAPEPPLGDPCLPCHIPHPRRNGGFFGRETVLERLDVEYLSPSVAATSKDTTEKLKVCALFGPGGVGKTEIAAEFVHSRELHFDAILWVNADQDAKIAEAFVVIALQLGLIQGVSPDARDPMVVRDTVKRWLANPAKKYDSLEKATWRLVFENADDLDIIGDYWPLNGPGAVLLTSRDPL